ncbi:MAG: CRTAC1 family protein, partial [Proteobacteria bacterium]|nr:CRTAC1 family protein [Pseudomonadota bacterium]
RIQNNLENYPGWWYAVSVVDLNQDGAQDLILGNRGENFYFSASEDQPAKLWLKDFDNNGTVEKIITRTIDGVDKPLPLKREITDQVVSLKKKNLKHNEYAGQSIQDLFSEEELKGAEIKESTWFKSIVALNDGQGNFEVVELPKEIQFSCICDIYCTDLNGDSYPDVILGGNDSGFLPQYSKLDGSFGHVMLNDGSGGLNLIPNKEAGIMIKGDLRQFIELSIQDEPHLLGILNNNKPIQYKIKKVNN